MRLRLPLAAMTAVAAVLALASPASAIRYGEPDDGEHPYVGMMIAYTSQDLPDDDVDGPVLVRSWRCTGTMLDVDTFLTAGHCTDGAAAVAIWFDEDLRALTADDYFLFEDAMKSADAHSTAVLTHPDYDAGAFYLHDVGVVDALTVAQDLALDGYGELPEEGYWDDQLALRRQQRDSLTTVGYGLQRNLPTVGGAAALIEADWVRLQAHSELIGDRQFGAAPAGGAYVVLGANANTGGACVADSGGPTLVEGTSTVVAVVSFSVNDPCGGTSAAYRIDTADDLAWLAGFVG